MNMAEITALMAEGREHEFYTSGEWERMRERIRRADRYECQHCKARGRYRRGSIVHHVKHLKDRPDLALAMYDPDTGERQLITVCKECHERAHPEVLQRQETTQKAAVTEERWD